MAEDQLKAPQSGSACNLHEAVQRCLIESAPDICKTLVYLDAGASESLQVTAGGARFLFGKWC